MDMRKQIAYAIRRAIRKQAEENRAFAPYIVLDDPLDATMIDGFVDLLRVADVILAEVSAVSDTSKSTTS
jgi:hypothetical protein